MTRFACIAHRFISSIRRTSQASMASWMANKAEAWNRRPILKSCVISLTNLATHNFRQSSSVLFLEFPDLSECHCARTIPVRFLDTPSRGFAFLGRFGWNRLSGGPLPCLSGTLHHPLVAFILWPWLTVWLLWPAPRTGHICDCFAPYRALSFSRWEAYLALFHSQERVPWGRLVFHHLALFLSVSFHFVQVL